MISAWAMFARANSASTIVELAHGTGTHPYDAVDEQSLALLHSFNARTVVSGEQQFGTRRQPSGGYSPTSANTMYVMHLTSGIRFHF